MDARRLALPTYLLLWSVSQFASADVYRCVDPKTKAVTYSGARCTASDAGKASITDNAIMDGSKFRREQTARQMDEAGGGDKNVPVRGKPRVESAPNRAQS